MQALRQGMLDMSKGWEELKGQARWNFVSNRDKNSKLAWTDVLTRAHYEVFLSFLYFIVISAYQKYYILSVKRQFFLTAFAIVISLYNIY